MKLYEHYSVNTPLFALNHIWIPARRRVLMTISYLRLEEPPLKVGFTPYTQNGCDSEYSVLGR